MLRDVASWATILGGASVVVGFVVWLTKMHVALESVKKSSGVIETRTLELEHNGGSSIKDAARRLEGQVAALSEFVFETRSDLRDTRLAAEQGLARVEKSQARVQSEVVRLRKNTEDTHSMLKTLNEDRLFKELEWRRMLIGQGIAVPEIRDNDGTVS